MVRMRGFKKLSKSHGYQRIFITITYPSKYHGVYSKLVNVIPNIKA